MTLFFGPGLNIRSRGQKAATRIPRCFAIPCEIGLLLWWVAVQGVYARSIGSTFARPANDNALGVRA